MPLLMAFSGLLVAAALIRLTNFLVVRNKSLLCPYCQTPYKGLFVLKGLCPSCGAPYLIPYVMAEIFTPVIFVLIWQNFGFAIYSAFALLYSTAFMALFLTDMSYKLIPDAVVYPAMVIAIIGEALRNSELGNHFLGGALSLLLFLAFYAFGQAFMRWKKVEEVAFGMGDVKLALLIGFILGYPEGLRALLAGVLFNGFVALAIIVKGIVSKRLSPFTPFPYGPGLILSFFIFWLLV